MEELKEIARKRFNNKSERVTIGTVYDFVNGATFLGKKQLLNCIKDIDDYFVVDKGYLYGDSVDDYLTAIVATALEEYIRTIVNVLDD